MAASIDLSNIPQDTCPLCRQRTLTLSENTLRCVHCQSVAELDDQTHRIRYITVDDQYSSYAADLKENWFSRRQIFELTTRPLPAVIFLPIILSLTALCVLLGGIAAVLAIRPSLMASRDLISAAYSRTVIPAGITTTLTTTVAALMSPEADITATAEVTSTDPALTGTLVVSIETPTLAPNPNGPATPVPPPTQAPATLIPSPTRSPNRSTATALPPTNTPVPTSVTRVVALTPTTLGQSSPLGTPTRAATALAGTATVVLTSTTPLTPDVGQTPTSTPTPTATSVGQVITPTTSPTETLVYSGTFPSGTVGRSVLLSNEIQVSDIKVKGDSSFNEGDEYIDLLNRSTQVVNMSFWRIRINGVAVYYIPGNSAASQNFAIPGGQGCRIYTGNVNTQQVPSPYNWCGTQSFLVTTSSIGLYQNEHGTIEILDEIGTVVARFTY